VVVHETGLQDRVEIVHVAGNAVDPGTMPVDVNPLGKIPALVCDDGQTIFDSPVICRYLNDLAHGSLYPAGPLVWDRLTLEAIADGIMEASILMVYESRLRPEALRFAPWVEGQWTKIARSLDMIETRWLHRLEGPVDIGQISMACALGHLDLRHAARTWRDGRTGLAKWAKEFALRPSMVATHPPG
jgi:glutathione S-transferase